jgi:DNA-binding CsgD family transcriptional regulator
MGAVEHLKNLCCLGLSPESAMIAVTPLMHEIISHGWSRVFLLEDDRAVGSTYAEHAGTAALYRERWWLLANDPTSLISLYPAAVRAIGIGWTLHRQGRDWLESANYREIEAPFDSCWILDAMIGDTGRSIAGIHLTRPRSARPFSVDDVRRLDPLRPWLGHAFRGRGRGDELQKECSPLGLIGAPVRSGEMILTPEARILYQTESCEWLLRRVVAGEPANYMRYVPTRDELPAPVVKLIRCIRGGAASEASKTPPRMQVSTPYGIVTLEAKWLMAAKANPSDVAKDPESCLIAVTIELREHPMAHAARVLRESGTTPAQMKVGIELAIGKSKPEIAKTLGIAPSSVASLAKKLYQTLDIHNSTELAAKIWLSTEQEAAHQILRRTA